MTYEVEQKFPVADMQELERCITALGATISDPQTEADLYFAHPARDFAKTDEALRIRRTGGDCPNFPKENGTVPLKPTKGNAKENGTVPLASSSTAAKNFLTYKGPKIDAATKTRLEIDLPLPAGQELANNWRRLLEALGFTPVAEVKKSRRKSYIVWQSYEVECSLDEVEKLGQFCELELISDEAGLEKAKAAIAALAAELGLKKSERRSYLELLLEAGVLDGDELR
jgi:adenylate cyclase, class 2